MAGVHAAAAAAPPFPPPAPISGTSRVSSPSLPSSFPSRVRRTNHLRQKILKTLENKPYPDPSNPQFPLQIHPISIEESQQKHPAESDQFSHSEGAGFGDGVLSTFSTRSFAKLGLYLVGAFIFQTICALLIFGSKDLDDEDDRLDSDGYKNQKKLISKSNAKSNLKSNLLSSGNGSSIETKEVEMELDQLVSKSEMDNRILEIQEMARQARQQEKAEAKRKGLVEEEDDDDGDGDDVDYGVIDKAMKLKEVDERLTKLRKSLEANNQKQAPKFPRKEGDVGKNLDDGSLMFKKKYRYKSPSIDSGDKPKGFGGTKDVYVANGTVINGGGTLSNDIGSGLTISVGKDEKEDQEPRATKAGSISGNSKEPIYDKQASKSEKSGKSSNLETKKPQGFGSLKGKKGINNIWWTSLPFVMAVHMERGGTSEESEGLFVLRDDSPSKNGLSHTVAFEDRSDAANFCYLLESFFQDLNDFRTDIVPIPTNELLELVKSQSMKVVVVKKGQLKLYVGQPLEDVESALRALIEQ